MNRRRIITRAIVFLLAGAVVNVAVAWGALVLSRATIQRAFVETAYVQLMRSVGRLEYIRHDAVTTETQVVQRHFAFACKITRCTREWASIKFSGDVVVDRARHAAISDRIDQILAGWPAMSLVHDVPQNAGVQAPSMRAGVRSPWQVQGPPVIEMRLPLVPIWPGFAINTVLYAAILWLLFAAPGTIRRRRRIKRGLCAVCAYPVGASEVCTECGARPSEWDPLRAVSGTKC